MKKTLKRSISFVLAFMIVFSMLTVLPSELFHSTYVHAAEAIAELAGADPEIYENDDFTYTLTDEYTKGQDHELQARFRRDRYPGHHRRKKGNLNRTECFPGQLDHIRNNGQKYRDNL